MSSASPELNTHAHPPHQDFLGLLARGGKAMSQHRSGKPDGKRKRESVCNRGLGFACSGTMEDRGCDEEGFGLSPRVENILLHTGPLPYGWGIEGHQETRDDLKLIVQKQGGDSQADISAVVDEFFTKATTNQKEGQTGKLHFDTGSDCTEASEVCLVLNGGEIFHPPTSVVLREGRDRKVSLVGVSIGIARCGLCCVCTGVWSARPEASVSRTLWHSIQGHVGAGALSPTKIPE